MYNFTQQDIIEIANILYPQSHCRLTIENGKNEKNVYLLPTKWTQDVSIWRERVESVQSGLNSIGDELIAHLQKEHNKVLNHQLLLEKTLNRFIEEKS